MNWKKCKLPKELGGLGILDLQMFSRALRLRWIWFEWKDPERPWVGSPTPCDNIDRQVFRVSTVVTVGNGAVDKFWHCSWLQGRAPIDIAPTLYKLAWRKQRTVQQELQNNNWTHGLWQMTTAQEMAEFIILWELVQGVQLSDETDSITWRWTADGSYTTKSAYKMQLQGTYSDGSQHKVWKAFAEGKVKFFAWVLL